MKQHHPPLTWARDGRAGAGVGVTDELTPTEREYVIGMAGTAGLKLLRIHDAQAPTGATLKLVRQIMGLSYMSNDGRVDDLRRALAGQPEAPACTSPGGIGDCYDIDCPSPACNPPEAPKEQESRAHLYMQLANDHAHECDRLQRDLAAANARADAAERATEAAIAGNSLATQRARTAESNAEDFERSLRSAETYIGEVNERVNQCEVALAAERTLAFVLQDERDQLAQKLEAAELEVKHLMGQAAFQERAYTALLRSKREILKSDEVLTGLIGDRDRVIAERDQLAARVTELETLAFHRETRITGLKSNQCTPEERKVLDAMGDYPEFILEDWKRDGRLRRKALAVAELANRAAKAKRGGQ